MNTNSKVTVGTFRKRKIAGEKISMITVYDATSASLCHQANVDALLVGDSLAMTVLGYKNTLPLTMDEALHHAKAVRRGAPDAFVIFDMPFMSYQADDSEALRNAGRVLKEAGADAVKLEGGAEVAPLIEKLVRNGIPVLAHIGLLPQHIMTSGGYRQTGKTPEDAARLLEDARKVEAAGAFATVLECMPSETGKMISEKISIPTIGIGSGPDCDGQVQVLNDLLGLYEEFTPKHARRYAELGKLFREAVGNYANDVKTGKFK
ncbi:MAG: 3-methyl-2-oxobutanoate hydroxymethyltransferase [Victivallales bacterium]|jgi:3-methyl-2-oxobutanoate hydroxymethyltransferase|nr:3-methyl-2-oxobutanoate hydroxymethyltransferase [Victivallales bacterium]